MMFRKRSKPTSRSRSAVPPVRAGLDTLPVELLLDIHLLSASSALPYINRQSRAVFASTTQRHRIVYLQQRLSEFGAFNSYEMVPYYPICTREIFLTFYEEAYGSLSCYGYGLRKAGIPRRLFKHLLAGPNQAAFGAVDMDLLQLLLHKGFDLNAYDGYALVCAVRSQNIDLIRYLLDTVCNKFAAPTLIPAMVEAVKQGELCILHMLMTASPKRMYRDVSEEVLRAAVQQRDEAITKHLLRWCDLSFESSQLAIKGALRLAVELGTWELFDLLAAHGACLDTQTAGATVSEPRYFVEDGVRIDIWDI